SLHAVGGREDRREIGIACVLVGERVLQQRQTVAVFQQYAQAETALPVAFVARPQRDELPALLPGKPTRGDELARADRTALRGHIAGERRSGHTERRDGQAEPIRWVLRPDGTSPRGTAESTDPASGPGRDGRIPAPLPAGRAGVRPSVRQTPSAAPWRIPRRT